MAKRAAIPDIRLKPLQKLTGQIDDRQGRAMRGTRAFVQAGGPATTSDAQGRFALTGINPAKAILVVEEGGTGFKDGWSIRRHRPSWVR